LLTKVLIMAIFAMSLDLLVGYTGLVSFGHAAYFGLAGYALALMAPKYEAVSLWWTLPARSASARCSRCSPACWCCARAASISSW
jgi:branched-chain amino acid transport system permease protein